MPLRDAEMILRADADHPVQDMGEAAIATGNLQAGAFSARNVEKLLKSSMQLASACGLSSN